MSVTDIVQEAFIFWVLADIKIGDSSSGIRHGRLTQPHWVSLSDNLILNQEIVVDETDGQK